MRILHSMAMTIAMFVSAGAMCEHAQAEGGCPQGTHPVRQGQYYTCAPNAKDRPWYVPSPRPRNPCWPRGCIPS